MVLATISTPEVDRQGDIVEPLGMDLTNFKKNPVVMFAHDYSSLPIGRARKIWADANGIYAEVEFAPFGVGEQAWGMARDGYLNAWSVGFAPITSEKIKHRDGRIGMRFTSAELLEFSAVPVPANAGALSAAMKAINAENAATWQWLGISREEYVEEARLRALQRKVAAVGEIAARAALEVYDATMELRASKERLIAKTHMMVDVGRMVMRGSSSAEDLAEFALHSDPVQAELRHGESLITKGARLV